MIVSAGNFPQMFRSLFPVRGLKHCQYPPPSKPILRVSWPIPREGIETNAIVNRLQLRGAVSWPIPREGIETALDFAVGLKEPSGFVAYSP